MFREAISSSARRVFKPKEKGKNIKEVTQNQARTPDYDEPKSVKTHKDIW